MTHVVEATFWVSIGTVLYAYCGYPVLILVAARLFGRRPTPPEVEDADWPSVVLLISALNEEKVIGERICNALKQSYSSGKMRIVIASDGSTDRTCEIVRHYASVYPQCVQLLEFAERRGKASVLNEVIQTLKCDVVVLSDANTRFAPQAIARLARWFVRKDVTVVCGRLTLIDATSGQNVDGIYWQYERFLKQCEGRLGALLGANGGIYAIRRSDYAPIPNDTVIDDFVIPMSAILKTRQKIVYDTEAEAFEDTPSHISDEFSRRCRIGAGGFQCMTRHWALLSPTMGWTAFAFLSHKLLRWLCPALLLLAAICNIGLLERPVYGFALLLQAGFYLAACLGAVTSGMGKAGKVLRLTTMFTSMNLALLLGSWRWLRGQQRGTWQRTAR